MTHNSLSYFTYFLMFWVLNCKRTYSLWLKTGSHFLGPLASSRWQQEQVTLILFSANCSLFLCSFPGVLLVVGLLVLHRPCTDTSSSSEPFSCPSTFLKRNNVGLNLRQSRTLFQCGGDPNPLVDRLYSIPSIVCLYEFILTSVAK